MRRGKVAKRWVWKHLRTIRKKLFRSHVSYAYAHTLTQTYTHTNSHSPYRAHHPINKKSHNTRVHKHTNTHTISNELHTSRRSGVLVLVRGPHRGVLAATLSGLSKMLIGNECQGERALQMVATAPPSWILHLGIQFGPKWRFHVNYCTFPSNVASLSASDWSRDSGTLS